MSTNMIWDVIYHFESGKKAAWDGYQKATVIAADNKEDTIRTVLTNNGIGRPGATIAIDRATRSSVPGGGDNVLS